MPNLYMIGGANGAGKTTFVKQVLSKIEKSIVFINTDDIAKALDPTYSTLTFIKAGRIMLTRIKEVATSGKDFGFETTMASRGFLSFIRECKQKGYRVHMVFISLASPELAIKRVSLRVNSGGHSVPKGDILRRYFRADANFKKFYRHLADTWQIIDNSQRKMIESSDGKREIEFDNL